MLRVFVKDFKGNWDDNLPSTEFSYNIATIRVFPWDIFKQYMVGDVGLGLGGLRFLSVNSFFPR